MLWQRREQQDLPLQEKEWKSNMLCTGEVVGLVNWLHVQVFNRSGRDRGRRVGFGTLVGAVLLMDGKGTSARNDFLEEV